MKMYPCPCCGYLTLSEKPPGTFEICEVCFWEDDYVQYHDPSYEGGANKVSLSRARDNFRRIGSSSEEFVKMVRKPNKCEQRK
ncbi:CPCC family cysteine-rich protein [Salinithrix halophila]|uniref:CPCC family cysteine-rich protein n=1 Tax=Salinithrix halophila TaxID=1485204 RepID=A0ABV8JD14_9BACL